MDKEPVSIPFIAHESECDRLFRIIKRLCAIIVFLILVIILGVVAFFVHESMYEDVVTTVEAEQEADGAGNNYIVGGDFTNGQAES